MNKKEKLKRILFLAVWSIIAVAVYFGAVNKGFLVVTAVYPILIILCAAAYAAVFWRIISLRAKADIAPDEKFDYEASDKLTDKDKSFLRKSESAVKVIVFIAVPLLFIVMIDFLYTHFFMGGVF